MELRDRLVETVPFTVMVIMEGCTIALTIMAKTVMTAGMSPFVFVVYTNALSSLLLLPYSFFFHRTDRSEQPITFRLFLRFFFLGLTGIAIAQNLAFVGLSYSSPIVVCVMGLVLPSMSFLLGIILSTTKLNGRSSSFYVKAIGTLISIIGATVVELYKGPLIRKSSPSSSSRLFRDLNPVLVFISTTENWILGGLLLAASSVSVSLWNVIQQGTVKQYPQVMKVTSSYSIMGTIQCTIFSLIAERDMNAWKLTLNMELLLIVLTAIFASIIRSSIHLTCTEMKGPFYVPLFKPFGIVFATIFGVTFFANSLHYGSVIGAVIAGMGYYTLMWGHIREDEKRKENDINSMDPDMKVSLLQEETLV